MFNTNFSILLLSVGGCCAYVYLMSALGRLLAACGESYAPVPAYVIPTAYVRPAQNRPFGA
jgi:hypothetical protein